RVPVRRGSGRNSGRTAAILPGATASGPRPAREVSRHGGLVAQPARITAEQFADALGGIAELAEGHATVESLLVAGNEPVAKPHARDALEHDQLPHAFGFLGSVTEQIAGIAGAAVADRIVELPEEGLTADMESVEHGRDLAATPMLAEEVVVIAAVFGEQGREAGRVMRAGGAGESLQQG